MSKKIFTTFLLFFLTGLIFFTYFSFSESTDFWAQCSDNCGALPTCPQNPTEPCCLTPSTQGTCDHSITFKGSGGYTQTYCCCAKPQWYLQNPPSWTCPPGPTCSISSITESSNYAYTSGTTIWYNTASTGSFTVNVNTNPTTGISKVNFPNTVSNGGDDTTSPYSQQYNWITTSTYNGVSTVTVYDTSGQTGSCTFAVNKDTTAPSTTDSITGTWCVSQTTTLTCSDTGGSGCDKTYYCIDSSNSCTPTTQYTGTLTTSYTTNAYIRFYSTDKVSNQENVKSDILCFLTPAKSITLSANPTSVLADGSSTSTITASLSDSRSGVSISFSTSLGTLSSSSCTSDSTGKCSVTIKSSSVGTATITASASGYTSGSVQVSFTIPPTIPSISVSANPTSVYADGLSTSTITAQTSNGASTTISFSTNLGVFTDTGTSSTSCTGSSCSKYIKSSSVGTATITASASGYTSGSVQVSFTIPPTTTTTQPTTTTTTQPTCSGEVSFSLSPTSTQTSGSVTPFVSGLSNCNGPVYFKKDSCSGTQVSSCSISGSGCTGTAFTAPSTAGTYTYYACFDKNGDGDYSDLGESDWNTLTVTERVCTGSVSLSLSPNVVVTGGGVTAQASGLSNCQGKYVHFRKDSCSGSIVTTCGITSGEGCSKSFTAPSTAGTYTYYACVDRDGDGVYDTSSSAALTTYTPGCTHSPLVTSTTWSCNNNGKCEPRESQDSCPNDCKSTIKMDYLSDGKVLLVINTSDYRINSTDDPFLEMKYKIMIGDNFEWNKTNGCISGEKFNSSNPNIKIGLGTAELRYVCALPEGVGGTITATPTINRNIFYCNEVLYNKDFSQGCNYWKTYKNDDCPSGYYYSSCGGGTAHTHIMFVMSPPSVCTFLWFYQSFPPVYGAKVSATLTYNLGANCPVGAASVALGSFSKCIICSWYGYSGSCIQTGYYTGSLNLYWTSEINQSTSDFSLYNFVSGAQGGLGIVDAYLSNVHVEGYASLASQYILPSVSLPISCNKNNVCDVNESQLTCPSDCKTYVEISPKRVSVGQTVNVTVYFNDYSYVQGEEFKIELRIDDRLWLECPMNNKKFKEDIGWDGSSSWSGKYSGTDIKITSQNGYAKVETSCIIPAGTSVGEHVLKAIPVRYSEEVKLRESETQFSVETNPLMTVLQIIFKIIFGGLI